MLLAAAACASHGRPATACLLTSGPLLQIAQAFQCKTAAVSVVDEERVLLKTAAPKAFAIVERHNYIFPRSLGLCGWLCLPECRQILVVDDPVSDIR